MRWFGAVYILLLAACASAGVAPAGGVTLPPAAAAKAPAPFPAQPTLADVLARVDATPILAARATDLVRAEALAEQAGRPPNPVVTAFGERIDVEDIGGGIQKRGIRVRERFETAGKRDARVDVAEARTFESEVALKSARIRLATAATTAHQLALSGQRILEAREDELRAAERLLAFEEKRFAAGRGLEAPVVAMRARTGRLRAAVAEEDAAVRTALRTLEGILALPPGTIGGVGGRLLGLEDLPEATAEALRRNPEVEALSAELLTAGAREREARAKAWPDVTAGIGLENGRDVGEHRTTLGMFVEAPIPVLDANEGAIRAAAADSYRVEDEIRSAEATAAAELLARRETADSLDRSRRVLRGEVVPAIEREVEIARSARRAGRADDRPVVEAELDFVATRRELLVLDRAVALEVAAALAVVGRTAVSGEEPSDL